MGACRKSGRRFFVHYFILNTYQNKEFIGFRYIGTGLVLCGQETDLSTRSRDFFQECLNRKENNTPYLKRIKFIKKTKTQLVI